MVPRVVAVVSFLCAGAFALVPSAVSAQSASGGIAGVVRDTTGALLPGVTVEASSPVLIEKVRSVVTDEQGQYKILDLRPGTYSMTFTLTGFSTFKREAIELPASFTANINVEMRVGSLEETITVSGQSPTVDIQNVQERKVLSQDVLNSLPTLRTPQSFVPYIPGVQGGLGEIGRDTANLSIHGSRPGEANVAVDGFEDHSLQGTGGAAFIYYINQGSVQEVAVEVSGQSAEQQSAGIRTNLIPKEGGNRFSGFLFAGYGGHATQADNLTDDLRARGLTAVNSLKKIYDVNPAWGGPIKQDKLWFYNAYRYWGSVNYVAGLYYNATPSAWYYTPDPTRQATTRVVDGSSNLRLTWQVTQKNKFGIFYDYQPHCTCNRNFSSTVSPEATEWAPFMPNQFAQASWKYTATNKLLIEAGVSSTFGNWQTRRQPGVADDAISVFEQDTGLVYRSDFTYGNHLNSPVLTRITASYVTGSHAAKFGFNINRGRRIDTMELGQQMRYRVTTRGGQPNRIVQYASPWVVESWMNADLGLFAQDQWTFRHLTLNLGVRYDYFNGSVPAQDEATLLDRFALPDPVFVPVRTFDPVYDVPNWHDVSPRLGAAYDLFGDGKTAVKVSLSEYPAGQSVAIADANNPLNTSVNSVNRTWTDSNRDWVPDCDLRNTLQNGECGQVDNLAFGQQNTQASKYADDVLHGYGVRPYSWEFSTGVQRELAQGVAVNASYYRRWYGNFYATDNVAQTASDFSSYCITAPSNPQLPGGGGYPVCGLYDTNKFGVVQNVITQVGNYGKQQDVYDGIDLTTNVRLPRGITLAGGLNIGRERANNCYLSDKPQLTTTTIVAPLIANSPRTEPYCDVRPPFQNQLKFFGVYPLPWWDIQTSATFQSLPGPQILASYTASSADARPTLGRNLSSGTATVALIPPGTMYGERANELDVSVKKLFRMNGVRVAANMEIFNVLNRSDVLNQNNTYGPDWLKPANILAGRWAKFGVQLDF
jgi:carboxypeptidase family protein